MTKEQAEKIKDFLRKEGVLFPEDVDDDPEASGVAAHCEANMRSDYSGRGMFGKKTYAIEAPRYLANSYPNLFKGFRWDSMGKYNLIWY